MYDRALRTLRQFHRLSQIVLADQLNLSRSYLNELERGKKEPSLDVLKRYAERFDMPLSSLQLFAEQIDGGPLGGTKAIIIDKVLRMLEWVAESPERESEEAGARGIANPY